MELYQLTMTKYEPGEFPYDRAEELEAQTVLKQREAEAVAGKEAGLGGDQIADELGIVPNTVYDNMSRAKNRLANCRRTLELASWEDRAEALESRTLLDSDEATVQALLEWDTDPAPYVDGDVDAIQEQISDRIKQGYDLLASIEEIDPEAPWEDEAEALADETILSATQAQVLVLSEREPHVSSVAEQLGKAQSTVSEHKANAKELIERAELTIREIGDCELRAEYLHQETLLNKGPANARALSEAGASNDDIAEVLDLTTETVYQYNHKVKQAVEDARNTLETVEADMSISHDNRE